MKNERADINEKIEIRRNYKIYKILLLINLLLDDFLKLIGYFKFFVHFFIIFF